MKNIKIIISLILSLAVVFSLSACGNNDEEENTTAGNTDFEKIEEIEIPLVTEEITEEVIVDYYEQDSTKSQVGLIVNSWLKIVSIGERDGNLSVLVRNISDKDVQYAVLTVICENKTYSFEMSTLTAGSSSILTCDGAVFNSNGQYHSWKISDEIIFSEPISLYPEVFEISGTDGCVSVKNISNKDIDGTIYVYYKSVVDGVFTEGTTYRIKIDGLKKGEETQVYSSHYVKDTSLVMFVTYGE